MENIRALVKTELEQVKYIIKNSYEGLETSDLKEFLQSDSKYVRSLLGILYLKVHNIDINSDIIKLLSVAELIHNASLLHDDVIDESNIRRGQNTIFNKSGAKLSILYGDYLLSLAVEKLLQLNNKEILNIFLNATKDMSSAEILQFKMRAKDITFQDYINIVSGKTASLFSAVLVSLAILLGLDTLKAEQFGKVFGIVFQINNDTSQASIENDKKNGVRTINNILTVEKVSALKDNYIEEMKKIIFNFPESEYKKGLEDLIELL